jgi:acetylornithine deacetylase
MSAQELIAAVDEGALVEMALEIVSIPSPTGSEWAMAERMRDVFRDLGLQVQLQEVEEGRANVIGVLEGSGGGPTLMFNGHMDTSYSGEEPWLQGIPGFQPRGFLQDGHVYGLGISNMKGALCAYVAAVRALQAVGARLRGDIMLAAVAGEIEKTQWYPAFTGREYRGYAAGSRHLVSFGGVADMCILGEPTEGKVVLGHYGALWLRLSTHGPFVHTAFAEGRLEENSIVRMQDVLAAVREWIPGWEERTAYRGHRGIVGIGAIDGGFAWRVSRTPHRTDLFLDVRVPPTLPMARARAEVLELVRSLRERFPEHGIEGEIFVTAPGSEIAEDHPLIAAVDEGHEQVFGARPERDSTRWFSDASVLARYGIETVNYGTSSGLPSATLGENLAVDGLVRIAQVYALAAAKVCG